MYTGPEDNVQQNHTPENDFFISHVNVHAFNIEFCCSLLLIFHLVHFVSFRFSVA